MTSEQRIGPENPLPQSRLSIALLHVHRLVHHELQDPRPGVVNRSFMSGRLVSQVVRPLRGCSHPAGGRPGCRPVCRPSTRTMLVCTKLVVLRRCHISEEHHPACSNRPLIGMSPINSINLVHRVRVQGVIGRHRVLASPAGRKHVGAVEGIHHVDAEKDCELGVSAGRASPGRSAVCHRTRPGLFAPGDAIIMFRT